MCVCECVCVHEGVSECVCVCACVVHANSLRTTGLYIDPLRGR